MLIQEKFIKVTLNSEQISFPFNNLSQLYFKLYTNRIVSIIKRFNKFTIPTLFVIFFKTLTENLIMNLEKLNKHLKEKFLFLILLHETRKLNRERDYLNVAYNYLKRMKRERERERDKKERRKEGRK